jgi:sterol desaturase/sphingolipid hydroxylase (fatty acid hydroxylase superfamily)
VRHLIDFNAILIVAAIFIPLELIVPLRAQQKLLRKHWLNDLVYLFVNGIAINVGIIFALGAIAAGTRLAIPQSIATAVQSQPVWLQAMEVLLVADIGFYLAHRLFHAIPFLWKFHSVHHSIEEMDWLAGHRVHPIDQILTKTASYFPILVLGFSDAAILIFVMIYKWQSIMIHSNSALRFGPLEWIFATPHFHHWHHANQEAAFDKNFAGQLVFIDAIAGTLFIPEGTPEKYGTDYPVPAWYHDQLVYPLREAVIPRGDSLSPTRGNIAS